MTQPLSFPADYAPKQSTGKKGLGNVRLVHKKSIVVGHIPWCICTVFVDEVDALLCLRLQGIGDISMISARLHGSVLSPYLSMRRS